MMKLNFWLIIVVKKYKLLMLKAFYGLKEKKRDYNIRFSIFIIKAQLIIFTLSTKRKSSQFQNTT